MSTYNEDFSIPLCDWVMLGFVVVGMLVVMAFRRFAERVGISWLS